MMDVDSSPTFHLSQQLFGHDADVRQIACSPGGFCSASRDRTVRVWQQSPPETGRIELKATKMAHEHFLSAVYFFDADKEGAGDVSPLPRKMLITCSNDKTVHVWDFESLLKSAEVSGSPSSPDQTITPILSLLGHSGPVSDVIFLHETKEFVTASWDKTIRIWKAGACTSILDAHKEAVWALMRAPNGDLLSASADKTIKRWRGGKCIQTYLGHTNCVRTLSLVPGIGFISSGNDMCIKLWSFEGECLQTLSGHSNFIYTAVYSPSLSLVASGSEDMTLKIWTLAGECLQTIKHPGNIWSICPLPNGDLATGCSDGTVRVWSQSPERRASDEVIADYEIGLEAAAAATAKVGDLSLAKLPGEEALQVAGTKDGETKIIKKGGSAFCYKWSSAQHQWENLGEVVNAKDRESSYTFNVDLGDGIERKLHYNDGENPYTVAQQFLWDNELDQDFLNQVADFITQNAKPVTIGEEAPMNAGDPFTGQSRYIPSQQQQQQPTQAPPSSAPLDPFTFSSSSSSEPTQKPKEYKYFPQRSPVTFEGGNTDLLLKKLTEFNSEVDASLSLSPKEIQQVEDLISTLKRTSYYHTSKLTNEQYSLFGKMLQWPGKQKLPAIDLVRLSVLHPDAALKFSAPGGSVLPTLLAGAHDAVAPISIMSLRATANLFFNSVLRASLSSSIESILDSIAESKFDENKPVRIAASTVLLNICVIKVLSNLDSDLCLRVASMLLEVLSVDEIDEDSLFRALVALGSLVWNDKEATESAKELEFPELIGKHTTSSSEKISLCAKDILSVLA